METSTTSMDASIYVNENNNSNDVVVEASGKVHVPHVSQGVKNLITEFRADLFRKRAWIAVDEPFAVPDQGCVLDAHDIETLCSSTHGDFALATPKSMPVYTNGKSLRGKVSESKFRSQVQKYHLCRKVAVSFDGKIYRATDAEIEAALQSKENAPRTDAATYVKAVQEVLRRHATKKARLGGSG